MGPKTCKMGLAQIWQCPPLQGKQTSWTLELDVNERTVKTFAARTCHSVELTQQHRIHSDIPSGIVRPSWTPLAWLSRVSNPHHHHVPYSMCFYPTQCSNRRYYVSCYVSSCSSVNKVYVPFVINNKQYVSIYLVLTYLSEMLPWIVDQNRLIWILSRAQQ